MTTAIIIRCDASPGLGYGHLYRCMVLARILRDAHGCDVLFAMQPDKAGAAYIDSAGFKAIIHNGVLAEGQWMALSCRKHHAGAVVLDVRTDLKKSEVDHLRKDGIVTISIDDGSDRRLACDLVFMPPVPQVTALDWDDFTGRRFIGFEWTLLDVPDHVPIAPSPEALPRVLVTMGGSDPAGLTPIAVSALERASTPLEMDIVIGPGFRQRDTLMQLLDKTRIRHQLYSNVRNMYAIMGRVDLAIVSFGHTAYELAAMGVPAIYLCLTEDHALSASAFMQQGMGISIGCYQDVTSHRLSRCVSATLLDTALRRQMASAGLEAIQGGGARRIAEVIMNRMEGSPEEGKALR